MPWDYWPGTQLWKMAVGRAQKGLLDNVSEESIEPKVERTSPIETFTPQLERTQPHPSRGALHHNLIGDHWTSHGERDPSFANTDEPHITRREELTHHHWRELKPPQLQS